MWEVPQGHVLYRYVCTHIGATAMFDPEEDETPKQERDIVAEWTDTVRELIDPHFSPARDAGDADLMLSTDELHYQLAQHAPEMPPKDYLRVILLALNFKSGHTGESFVWYLKQR